MIYLKRGMSLNISEEFRLNVSIINNAVAIITEIAKLFYIIFLIDLCFFNLYNFPLPPLMLRLITVCIKTFFFNYIPKETKYFCKKKQPLFLPAFTKILLSFNFNIRIFSYVW